MKVQHYISAFVLALLLVPATALVARAETTNPTNAELQALVDDLADRVEALEKDLTKAEEKISNLESRLGKVGSTTPWVKKDDKKGPWKRDLNEKGDKKVCHMGQTLEVGGFAALAHIIQHSGDTLGKCAGDDSLDDADDSDDDSEDDSDDDANDDSDDDN